MSISNAAAYTFSERCPPSLSCIYEVAHLWRSFRASPASIYRAEIKYLSLLVGVRHVPHSPDRTQVSPGLSGPLWDATAPRFFARRCWLQQPAGESADRQANTGRALQTSHLRVRMGTASPQSTRVSDCLSVSLHTPWCVLVLHVQTQVNNRD